MPIKAREVRELTKAAGMAPNHPMVKICETLAEEQYLLTKRLFDLANTVDRLIDELTKMVEVSGKLKNNYERLMKHRQFPMESEDDVPPAV